MMVFQPSLAARVFLYPIIFNPKPKVAKISFNLGSPRFEPTTIQMPSQ